jgi:single-stranded-DNA-specific exonuclease
MISELKPFGFGNTEPVFATKNVTIVDSKLVGSEGKHVKLKLSQKSDAVIIFDAIAFGMGKDIANLRPGTVVDVAYTVDMNYWNGRSKLQLKVKDILFASD